VVIGESKHQTQSISEAIIIAPEEVTPILPKGVISTNSKTDKIPFYGYEQNTEKIKEVTTIAFKNNKAPLLNLSKTYGATLKCYVLTPLTAIFYWSTPK
jgi:hypothetical protein